MWQDTNPESDAQWAVECDPVLAVALSALAVLAGLLARTTLAIVLMMLAGAWAAVALRQQDGASTRTRS